MAMESKWKMKNEQRPQKEVEAKKVEEITRKSSARELEGEVHFWLPEPEGGGQGEDLSQDQGHRSGT